MAAMVKGFRFLFAPGLLMIVPAQDVPMFLAGRSWAAWLAPMKVTGSHPMAGRFFTCPATRVEERGREVIVNIFFIEALCLFS